MDVKISVLHTIIVRTVPSFAYFIYEMHTSISVIDCNYTLTIADFAIKKRHELQNKVLKFFTHTTSGKSATLFQKTLSWHTLIMKLDAIICV